jgi:hypothetical protein
MMRASEGEGRLAGSGGFPQKPRLKRRQMVTNEPSLFTRRTDIPSFEPSLLGDTPRSWTRFARALFTFV